MLLESQLEKDLTKHEAETVCLLYGHNEVQLLSTYHSTVELFSSYLVSFKRAFQFLILIQQVLQVEPSDCWNYVGGPPIPLSGHRSRFGLGWRVENAAGNIFQFFFLSNH